MRTGVKYLFLKAKEVWYICIVVSYNSSFHGTYFGFPWVVPELQEFHLKTCRLSVTVQTQPPRFKKAERKKKKMHLKDMVVMGLPVRIGEASPSIILYM